MRTFIFYFLFLLSSYSLNGQTNPYFVEESYKISELSEHNITDYYHSDDMAIYVLSDNSGEDFLTKIDTSGTALWSKAIGDYKYTKLVFDRAKKRIVLGNANQVGIFHEDGTEDRIYLIQNETTLVASNDGVEYFAKIDSFDTAFRSQLFKYDGIGGVPQLLFSERLLDLNMQTIRTYTKLDHVFQFGSDYFDYSLVCRYWIPPTLLFRGQHIYYRFDWDGQPIYNIKKEQYDSGIGPVIYNSTKILHSGKIINVELDSWGDYRYELPECGLKFYEYSPVWVYNPQAVELSNNIILFGWDSVNTCVGNILVAEKVNNPEKILKYRSGIDHKGVLYGFNNKRLQLLKWKFVDNDGDGYWGNFDDCNDDDPSINAGAMEIIGNAVDENCDGIAEVDMDGDGYGNASDCNDLDSLINPGVVEILGNGIDDDCDSTTYDFAIVTINDQKLFNQIILNGFDLNGDGLISLPEGNLIDTLIVPNADINNLDGLEHFKNLVYLDCSSNKIENIDIGLYKKLAYLDANSNLLNNFTLLDENVLKYLDLSKNTNLNSISAFLNINYDSLKYLNVSRCNLNGLDLKKFPNLTYLDLSYNASLNNFLFFNINDLSNSIEHLDFSHCSITRMPFHLFEMKGLRYLNFGGNKIETVHIPKLDSLEYLIGDSNIGRVIEFTHSELLNLKYLSLENMMEYYYRFIYIEVDQLKNIEYLNLRNNRMFEKFVLKDLPFLEEAYLDENEFLGFEIENTPKLRVLDIGSWSSTGLGGRPEIPHLVLSDLPSLEVIDIERCGVKTLVLKDIPSLKKISVNQNFIEELNLNSLSKLEWVNISDNPNLKRLFIKNQSTETIFNGFLNQIPISHTLDLICSDETDSVVLDALLITSDCTFKDEDSDGYSSDLDCNDLDSLVNQAQVEIVYNGVDDDCDPSTLDDDLDQDGYAIISDCNDYNPSINPGAIEILGNAIDENCDGIAEVDQDGDGYGNANDCNDDNPLINPGMIEIPYNGIDDDCNPATIDNPINRLPYHVSRGSSIDSIGGEIKIEDRSRYDRSSESWFTIYPNPATSVINILSSSIESSEFQILDMYGRQIQTGDFIKNMSLDVSAYSSGIYIINISSTYDNRSSTKRFIKI